MTFQLNNCRGSGSGKRSGIAPKLDTFITTPLYRSQIDDHDAIFRQIQVGPDHILEVLKFHLSQFASEYRILERVPMSAHRRVDLSIPLFAADIVCD